MSKRRINLHMPKAESFSSNHSDKPSSITDQIVEASFLNMAGQKAKSSEPFQLRSIEKLKNMLKKTTEKLNTQSKISPQTSPTNGLAEKNKEIEKLKNRINVLELEK